MKKRLEEVNMEGNQNVGSARETRRQFEVRVMELQQRRKVRKVNQVDCVECKTQHVINEMLRKEDRLREEIINISKQHELFLSTKSIKLKEAQQRYRS